jgi:cell division protein FtsX
MAKHYKIKLEDKAAFLNKIEKVGVKVDSFQIKNNKLEDVFEFDVNDPQAIKIIDTVLKDSPKINTVKEQLKAIVREELKNIKNRG